MRGAILVSLVVALAAAGAYLALKPQPSARTAARSGVAEAPPLPEEPPAPGPATATAARTRIAGKVTGEAPLADVRVEATWEGGGASGATNTKGEYGIEIAPTPEKAREARLVAEAEDGRVGYGRGWIDPAKEETRASDIALGPAAGVLIVTEPRADAALQLSILRDAGGHPFPVPLPLLHAGNGEVRARLAHGRYDLVTHVPGFGRTKLAFEVDAGTREVRVPLAAERQLKVLVRSKADGTWILGARLRLFESWQEYGTPVAFTDAMGTALLRGLNRADKLMLEVVGPGEAPQGDERGPSARKRHPVPADVDEMLLEIDPPRAISWLVEPGDIPPPPDGTVIPLRAQPGTVVTPPAQGVMRGGRLMTEGWPPMAAHADALGPEGTVARLFCGTDTDEGTPTRFMRACSITVVVRRADGTPAPGIAVGIFNQGNNLMAQAATDGDGVAKLDMLDGQLAELYVIGQSAYERREEIGTVDLRKGDLRIEHTLMGRRRFEISVLADGKPSLPEGRQVGIGSSMEEVAYDEEQGLVTGLVAVRDGTPKVPAWCGAPGYLRETASIDVPGGDEPIRHTFQLRRGGELRVREIGKPPDRFDLILERQEAEGWQTRDARNMFPRIARKPADDGWTFTGLEPGTYRMRGDCVVFGPVTLAADGGPELVLDYTRIAAIAGRVEVPEGVPPFEATLLLEVDGIDPDTLNPTWGQPRRAGKDGTFRILVPGDRKARLTVRHSRLAPDPKRGSIETVTGAEGVVLALVPGPSLRFRIPQFFEKYRERFEKYPRWQRPHAAVRLFRGEPLGRPEFTVTAQAEDREWKGGGFAPGTYTLWIDVPESVPVVRRGVKLDGDADLGDLPMEPGSTLRIRVLVREPFAAPRVHVWANRLGEPRYYRGVNSNGEDVVLVPGLAAGRYRVTGGVTMASSPGRMLNEEIEVDGTTDVERTLDLR